MQILKSATKLVLLGLTLVLAVITLYSAVIGIYRGTLDPSKVLEMFGSVMLFVTGYYFSKRETPEVNQG